ncbi:Transcriptional regulator, IclR family [Caballeronia glathei]|uniref:IclR family transcriptional regulator n=1 Tax=Caballeronia glathei TaxID=60547 RepID=UPI00050474EE|nr:IclR family transcriptional regulator [Caballeronia glathei]CDY79597.1 Transcriptional regulator, IclR family [Caballeronia glathei]
MEDSTERNHEKAATSSLQRSFALIRALAASPEGGERVTQLAKDVGLTQGTAHRLLKALMAEGMVEQDERTKRYRLSLELFAIAARAQDRGNFRDLTRPALLRLSASLRDTVFLLARSGFDAVCLDRTEGPFPIRSFTGDIGGRVALGVGQGSLAILAFLPEAEREEVIRFNLPRMRDYQMVDEVYLRTEIARTRELGYTMTNTGVLEGMAGLAVPVLDRNGRAVAALSIGTLADRLKAERLPAAVELLRREANAIGPMINPFDPVLHRPAQSFIR